MPEYLFRRTGGVVGLLICLIEEACMAAIGDGTERLGMELLDSVAIDLGRLPGRDPSAGEIPDLPPQPREREKRGKRGRNTVFDDRGAAGAAAR
jgi:hypothetical protein